MWQPFLCFFFRAGWRTLVLVSCVPCPVSCLTLCLGLALIFGLFVAFVGGDTPTTPPPQPPTIFVPQNPVTVGLPFEILVQQPLGGYNLSKCSFKLKDGDNLFCLFDSFELKADNAQSIVKQAVIYGCPPSSLVVQLTCEENIAPEKTIQLRQGGKISTVLEAASFDKDLTAALKLESVGAVHFITDVTCKITANEKMMPLGKDNGVS